MKGFAEALGGGDRRSIGRANFVVAQVRRDSARFEELWTCLYHSDALVRMRSADALEKLSRDNADSFDAHKHELLSRSPDDGTPETRWHLIAIASRLTLNANEAEDLCAYLDHSLRHDPSRIVKVMSLQSAHALASRHPALTNNLRRMLKYARLTPWPSVSARARKLGALP